MFYLRAALAVGLALACEPPASSEWSAFNVSIQAIRNNPLSLAAAETMMTEFCNEFDISPCAPSSASDTAATVTGQFSLRIPIESALELALPWLMLHRDAYALGYPVSERRNLGRE